mgnify:CR=1 FL=1
MVPRVVKKEAPSADKKKKVARRNETYNRFILKVLHQVHSQFSIGCNAMVIMNNFVNDIFERFIQEAGLLARRHKKSTISSHEIKAAVELILPGDLAKHALQEGSRALDKYTKSHE